MAMMGRSLKPDEQRELDELAAKALLAFDFVVENGLLFPGAEVFRADIERARDEGNLRGMRMAWRDTCEMVESMDPTTRSKLDMLMRRSLGVGFASEQVRFERDIGAIKRRGAVSTEDEYRLLVSRVAQVEDLPASRTEVAELRRLIDAFERGRSNR